MCNKNLTYIIGHINPDLDSIASAIGYSFLKNALGIQAIPSRLGECNAETKYLLNRFGFEEPYLLEDARVTLKEIELDKPSIITEETTIFQALNIMDKLSLTSLGVCDEQERLLGMITRGDCSRIGLGDTALGIDLLKATPVKAMNQTLSGTLVYEDEQTHINGKVSIVALSKDKVNNYEIKDRIVIVGNDSSSQKQLIKNGAGLLIVVWSESIDDSVVETAKKYHCPIILSGHGSMNTSRYLYFSVPVKLVMTKQPLCFSCDELAQDAGQKMLHSRYRSYPVLDNNRKLVGFVSRYHIMNYTNKKIILVDHNEFSQSVQGIEKAELLEVIDHHRINDFSTSCPVSFRNEIVGSTATIVATIFKENQIPIPSNLAGLLLGAILSDTIKFQSPTTTQKDKDIANMLATFARLNIDEFAAEIFTVSSDISGKSMKELISTDIKYFEIHDLKLMVSQVIVPCVNYVYNLDVEIMQALEKIVKQKGLDVCTVAFTSVLENGSVFYSAGKKKDLVLFAYPDKENEIHSLQKGILSRKNQIIPMITKSATMFKT